MGPVTHTLSAVLAHKPLVATVLVAGTAASSPFLNNVYLVISVIVAMTVILGAVVRVNGYVQARAIKKSKLDEVLAQVTPGSGRFDPSITEDHFAPDGKINLSDAMAATWRRTGRLETKVDALTVTIAEDRTHAEDRNRELAEALAATTRQTAESLATTTRQTAEALAALTLRTAATADCAGRLSPPSSSPLSPSP